MPKYTPFPDNSEVMDVFCCVVLGKSRVKDIMKALKQPQSTVSEKLRFLRKNRIVNKNKWVYTVNWKKVLSITKKEVGQIIGDEFMEMFGDDRLRNIITTYARMLIEEKTARSPVSLADVVWKYFLGLLQMDSRELKWMDKKFVELKKKVKLNMLSEEELLFVECEK